MPMNQNKAFPPLGDINSATVSNDAATYYLNRKPQTLQFTPLDQVTNPTVATDAAAHYLNRKPQTLRSWACLENGPLRPIRINGRLAWSVVGIKALLIGGA